MRIKKLTLFGLFAVTTLTAVLFTACNENAKTKETIVIDSTNIKNNKRVIDTDAVSRPLLPGGK